jgi:hypothetical protein
MRRRLPFLVVVFVLATLGVLLHLGAFEIQGEAGRTIHVVFNYGEAVVWGIAGAWVFWRSRKQHRAARILGSVASAAFLAFGVSDLIETRTGAWYEPWWLLAWKAACVVVLVACLCVHARQSRRGGTR